MDPTQIHYFLALARTLNFTRAAEACNVTQHALTKSIQRLEEELGGPSLLRERALTQLTPLGRAMLPLLEQARDEHGARPATWHQADTAACVADLVRAGLGVAATTERAAPPAALHRQPVACRAAHDVMLVAVAGRPFTGAADAFIKLARAWGWQPASDAA